MKISGIERGSRDDLLANQRISNEEGKKRQERRLSDDPRLVELAEA